MITHADAVYNALVELGKPSQYRAIKDKTDMSETQLYESLRFLFRHDRITREYKYIKHVRRGKRRMVWAIK